MHSLDETIVAIASPLGGAARGVVRLSGPNLRGCLENCFRPDPPQSLASLTPAAVAPGVLWLDGFTSPAPCQLYFWAGTRSYTGQPVAEVHTLGSPPLLEAVVRAACRGGARPAEPGEFTLRAFLAGRIDLTQAEAVLGVIDATGAAELDAALKQLAGGLAGPLRRLRDDLLELLAHLEAGFDFADEDLPFIKVEELLSQLQAASSQVDELVKKLAFRGESAARVRVALVGPPNAGKSSLFNALAGRQGAIVSEIAGTTRDYLTAELDLDGIKCELIDTAGIRWSFFGIWHGRTCRPADDARTVSSSTRADHLCRIARNWRSRRDENWECRFSGRNRRVDEVRSGDLVHRPRRVDASDQRGDRCRHPRNEVRDPCSRIAGLDAAKRGSCRDGRALWRIAAAGSRLARSCESGVRERFGEELIATEVRVALNELGKVAGAVYTEDVLDRIFSRFCIGK